MVLICFFFMIVEIIGGLLSHSLAILTDAAHMLSDVAAFIISLFSIWIGQRKNDMTQTYGYHRAEVLGAVGSILIIWIMIVWLLWEAFQRFIDHESYEIDAFVMLVTSVIALVCNLVSLAALGHLPCCKIGNADFMDDFESVYKPHGGHSCGGHDHGHGHGHSHSHKHDHDHTRETKGTKYNVQTFVTDQSIANRSSIAPSDMMMGSQLGEAPKGGDLISGFGGVKKRKFCDDSECALKHNHDDELNELKASHCKKCHSQCDHTEHCDPKF